MKSPQDCSCPLTILALVSLIVSPAQLCRAGFNVWGTGLEPNVWITVPGHITDNNGYVRPANVSVYGDADSNNYQQSCVWETAPCEWFEVWSPDGPAEVNGVSYSASGTIRFAVQDTIFSWRCITTCAETGTINVFPTGITNYKCNDKKLGGDSNCHGMAHYSAHAMLASLNIQDTPIGYNPARGPAVNFSVTYNQRDVHQPYEFKYSNLGPKWTFNWLSYVTDDPNDAAASAAVYVSGGGVETYSNFDPNSQSYQPDPQSYAVLFRASSNAYERRLPDGSKQIFALRDNAVNYPRRIFLTQVVDPAGNVATIGFDANFRVTTVTDALGYVTMLSYELANDPLKITKVTDPFGRYAVFSYVNGQLTAITDPVGIQSQFHYSAGTNFIDSLTTPYGTTTFSKGGSGTNKWIE